MIGLDILHYGILSDQVEIKINLKFACLLKNSVFEGYFEFVSEYFSLVRSSSELKHLETVFAYLKILLIVLLPMLHWICLVAGGILGNYNNF